MDKFSDVSTFLSPDIKQLYDKTKNINPISIEDEEGYTLSVIQQWDSRLTKITKDVYLMGKVSIERLENFVVILNEICHLDTSSAFDTFDLSWTTMESVLSKTIKWLSYTNCCYHYMALLQICSVMERVLGKIYQLKGNTVPFLLRDLIDTKELENIIEKDLVHFIKVFIGSVHGFNFRNIAWHGFLGQEDVHKEHSVVLIYSLHKCGEILKKKNLHLSCSSNMVDHKMTFAYYKHLKTFEIEEGDPMEIIANSKYVYKIMFPFWQEAVRLISFRDHDVLLLLLPLLENSLRILYAAVNDCPLKILTATDSTFYTTMDEILSPWGKPSESTINKVTQSKEVVGESADKLNLNYNLVPQCLGRPLTEALYDLFHHVSGPRLRDRISHGEFMPQDVPFSIIQHLFRLCLLVLSIDRWRFSQKDSQYTITCSCESSEEKSNKCDHHYPSDLEECIINLKLFNSPIMTSPNSFLISYIVCYEVAFHPATILKRNVLDVLLLLKDWKEWKCPTDDLELSWEQSVLSISSTYDWIYLFGKFSTISINHIESVIERAPILLHNVLFNSKLELEIIRTLQRIVTSILKSLENIKSSLSSKYSLYIIKSLRSRQREAYIKQLKTIPDIVNHLFINVQMILFILESYCHWRHVNISVYEPLKKMLKKVLKVVENLVSFTDPSINNYHNALTKLNENTQIINDYFQVVPTL